MKKLKQKRELVNLFIAFLFSLVLFFNANGTKRQSAPFSSEAYEETVEEVPVTIVYNSNDYFIQGYEATVTVKLESINRIQLNAEANSETRKFKVVADLSELGTGTHDVPLKVENLSNSVSATVDPHVFTVTIENKVTQSFPVEVNFSQKELPNGTSISKTALDPETVQVTTGDQTVKEIAKVIAPLQSVGEINESTQQTVPVYAVNEKGEVLPAEIDPENVEAQVLVNSPQKDVGLAIEEQGTPAQGISHFEFQFEQSHATISGAQEQLDLLDTIMIPIDVTDITEESTIEKEVPVDEPLIADPSVVKIKVVPVYEENSQTNESTEQSSKEQSSKTSSSSTVTSETISTTDSTSASN